MGVDQEYERLVRADLVPGQPDKLDLPALLDAGGRRLRRRRTAITGGVVATVAAAVALPALVLTTGSGPSSDPGGRTPPYAGTSSGPSNSPAPDPVTLRGCGWFACAEDDLADTRPILGETLVVNQTPKGADEVVWASERELYDPATDQDVTGPVIMTGFAEGDRRIDGVFALQPGHEFDPGCRMSFYSALTFDAGWAVLGYVDGAADTVIYAGGTGDGTAVSSTTVLPGYTVFVAHGPGRADGDQPTSFTATVENGRVTGPLAGCTVTG